ncbi:hypothetical protein LZ32DRAFT_59980 [Colletotrichum eremochloae]|nr:hypothetical protein LZ32DRAFT_59980 [Colletotrichum eremochloae]
MNGEDMDVSLRLSHTKDLVISYSAVKYQKAHMRYLEENGFKAEPENPNDKLYEIHIKGLIIEDIGPSQNGDKENSYDLTFKEEIDWERVNRALCLKYKEPFSEQKESSDIIRTVYGTWQGFEDVAKPAMESNGKRAGQSRRMMRYLREKMRNASST